MARTVVLAAQGGHEGLASSCWNAKKVGMKTALLAAILVIFCGALISCGGKGSSAFVARYTNAVSVIQWTQNGSNLVGSLTSSELTNGGTNLESKTESFSGVIDGGNITLTFAQGLGFTSNVNGSIQSDGLHLNMPNNSSGIEEVVYVRSSLGDYQDRVTELRASAAAQLAADQRQVQAEAQAQAVQQQQQQAANAVAESHATASAAVSNANQDYQSAQSALSTALEGLNNHPSFSDVSGSYADHWTKMQADYQKEKDDANQRPLTCSGLGTVESDVGTIESDLGSIESDDGSLQSVEASTDSELDQTKTAIAQLSKAFSALGLAIRADHFDNFVPPKRSDYEATMEKSKSAVGQVGGELAALKAKADSYDRSASALQKRASQFASALSCS